MSLNDRAYETMIRAVGFVAAKHAAWQGRRFEAVLERCRDVQDSVLIRTVRANQDSDFGRRHGFDRINSISPTRCRWRGLAISRRISIAVVPVTARHFWGHPRNSRCLH